MDGVFPGRPQSFRYRRRPVDDCSPAQGEMAQEGGTGAERFMATWIAAEKARDVLGFIAVVVVCPNAKRRTNDRIAQSKRARAGLLAIVN